MVSDNFFLLANQKSKDRNVKSLFRLIADLRKCSKLQRYARDAEDVHSDHDSYDDDDECDDGAGKADESLDALSESEDDDLVGDGVMSPDDDHKLGRGGMKKAMNGSGKTRDVESKKTQTSGEHFKPGIIWSIVRVRQIRETKKL